MGHHAAQTPVDGTNHYNMFIGTDLSDTFCGILGTDVMYGGVGSERLYGASGKDMLVGGTSQDFLYGGNGADRFVYNAAADAGRPQMSDVIGDFKSGDDHIDVHSFMAGGHFIGSAAFAATGSAQVNYNATTGVLQGDVNGDGVADFAITLANHAAVAATDFIF